MPKQRPALCQYFVDEAGDTNVFGRGGRVLVGRDGTSLSFMIGMGEVADTRLVSEKLSALRAELLADPYFKNVPSMQPAVRKTALAFHAKDDMPEVRREVFRLIPSFSPKITIAVKRKSALVGLGKTGVLITSNQLYDGVMTEAAKYLMHRADEIRVVVAKRGNTTRNAAILAALENGRRAFNRKFGTSYSQPIKVTVGAPSDHPALQVIDYLLWAVQRLFEKREDRYFESVAECYSMIFDFDDTRTKPYGEWYRRRNLPTLETLLPLVTG